MSIKIASSDNKVVEFNKDSLKTYSPFIKAALSGEDVSELKLDISSQNLEFLNEYIQHHGANESNAPPHPIPSAPTLEKVLDQWDAPYFAKIAVVDPYYKSFSKMVSMMQCDNLLYKVCAAIAIHLKNTTDGDLDKITEEIKKLDIPVDTSSSSSSSSSSASVSSVAEKLEKIDINEDVDEDDEDPEDDEF